MKRPLVSLPVKKSNNKKKSLTERIRVGEHPLYINLLFAVRTRLLFAYNAPSSYTKLVEAEDQLRKFLESKCT